MLDGLVVAQKLRDGQLGNDQPDNERAQARVYALWSFAKAYVSEKDRVMVDGGKGAEIRVRVEFQYCDCFRCVGWFWQYWHPVSQPSACSLRAKTTRNVERKFTVTVLCFIVTLYVSVEKL